MEQRSDAPTTSSVVVKTFAKTCNACPAQWEGEDVDGRRVYIRYRGGSLTVDVDDREVFELQAGGWCDGWMTTDVMRILTTGPLDWSMAKQKPGCQDTASLELNDLI